MPLDINQFKAQFTLGGQRASLFQVTIVNPVTSVADLKVPFMVKAATVPASTLGAIEVPFQGRKIKVAGDRTYAEWQVTVISDEDHLIRNAMEEWSHAINTPQGNVSKLGSASPLLYKSTAEVTVFSKTGAPVRIYRLNGLWPSEIGQADFAWESSDTILEFPVTFQFDDWEISGGVTGNAGGN